MNTVIVRSEDGTLRREMSFSELLLLRVLERKARSLKNSCALSFTSVLFISKSFCVFALPFLSLPVSHFERTHILCFQQTVNSAFSFSSGISSISSKLSFLVQSRTSNVPITPINKPNMKRTPTIIRICCPKNQHSNSIIFYHSVQPIFPTFAMEITVNL